MIHYIHNSLGAGHFTMAFEVLPQTWWDRLWKKFDVRWALAYCLPRDEYSQEEGERIAAARLQFINKRPSLRSRGFVGILRLPVRLSHMMRLRLHRIARENTPEIWSRNIEIND